MSAYAQGARRRPDRRAGGPRARPRELLARGDRGHRAGRPVLHGRVLVHARSGLAADHEPLQRPDAGAAAGSARARVLRGRRQQAGRRGPFAERHVDAPRGDRRRPEREPALAREHRDGRRPGAHRRPAHVGRDVGRPRSLPRAGGPDVRRRRDRLRPHDRPGARRGRQARAADRRGHGPRGPGAARAARPLVGLGGRVGDARRRALGVRPPRRRLGRRAPPLRGAGGRGAGAALGRGPRPAGRGGARARADAFREVGRPARGHAGQRRQPPRRG